MAATGGDPEPLTIPRADGEAHGEPHFLPGGKALLFTIATATTNHIAVYSLEAGTWEALWAGTHPHYSVGHVVFQQVAVKCCSSRKS